MSLYYIIGNLMWGLGALLVMRWRRIRFSWRFLFVILAFFPLVLFHGYMIDRIYYYGQGTTQILLFHLLYLDDIIFFVCFPFFIAVFVEAFGHGKNQK